MMLTIRVKDLGGGIDVIHQSKRTELDSELTAALDGAGFFYSSGYCDYVASQGNTPTYLYDSDFVLLVVLKKRGLFRFADLPVEYFQYSQRESASARDFLDNCLHYLETKLKLQWVNQPYSSARFMETPTNCLKIPYGNHLVDITRDEKEIWDAFDSANRNRIRKAEKSGVEIRCGGLELLDDFYRLDLETNERSCLVPRERAFYEEQFKYFPEHIKVMVAYYNGEPQGASFSYCDAHSCYYMYGASAGKSETGSVNLLVWRMLQEMKEKQMETFSFVGARINPDPESKFYGINKFKARFSAEMEICYLFKVIFNIRMYKTYDRIKKLNKSIGDYPYVQDIIDQEMSKWTAMNDPKLLKAVYGDWILKADSSDRLDGALS